MSALAFDVASRSLAEEDPYTWAWLRTFARRPHADADRNASVTSCSVGGAVGRRPDSRHSLLHDNRPPASSREAYRSAPPTHGRAQVADNPVGAATGPSHRRPHGLRRPDGSEPTPQAAPPSPPVAGDPKSKHTP